MQVLIAFVIGVLFASGLFMMMRRSIVKLIIGLALLGHAVNLLIFAVGRIARATPPVIAPGSTTPNEFVADPLPQALALTAIVIGFGVQAFAMVIVKRTYQITGTDDLKEVRLTEVSAPVSQDSP